MNKSFEPLQSQQKMIKIVYISSDNSCRTSLAENKRNQTFNVNTEFYKTKQSSPDNT